MFRLLCAIRYDDGHRHHRNGHAPHALRLGFAFLYVFHDTELQTWAALSCEKVESDIAPRLLDGVKDGPISIIKFTVFV